MSAGLQAAIALGIICLILLLVVLHFLGKFSSTSNFAGSHAGSQTGQLGVSTMITWHCVDVHLYIYRSAIALGIVCLILSLVVLLFLGNFSSASNLAGSHADFLDEIFRGIPMIIRVLPGIVLVSVC